MDDLIGEIASWQLDRRRPLWECWVLEGLADDLDDAAARPPSGRRVGFLVKMHHAMADGVAAAALLANVMEVAADAVDPPPPVVPWRPEPAPTVVAAARRRGARRGCRDPRGCRRCSDGHARGVRAVTAPPARRPR